MKLKKKEFLLRTDGQKPKVLQEALADLKI